MTPPSASFANQVVETNRPGSEATFTIASTSYRVTATRPDSRSRSRNPRTGSPGRADASCCAASRFPKMKAPPPAIATASRSRTAAGTIPPRSMFSVMKRAHASGTVTITVAAHAGFLFGFGFRYPSSFARSSAVASRVVVVFMNAG